MKVQKGSIESIILFCLSPFLSLPFLLYNLIKGNKIVLLLFSLFIGLISYLFIPTFSNDKTRYLERNIVYKLLDFNQYIVYLAESKRPDFIFETLIYFFSRYQINIHILFFIVTSFSVFSIFKFVLLFIDNVDKKINIQIFFLLLFSLSLQGVFSGIRFLFGVSFLLWGINYYIIKNRKVGIVFFLLAIATHFSILFFTPAIILLKLSTNNFIKINLFKLYVVSLLFLLIPQSVFTILLGKVEFSEGYSNKVNQYSQGEDFVSAGLVKGIVQQLIYYSRVGWIYVVYIYLLFNKKYDKNSVISKILFCFIFFLNITYSIPTAYSRFLNLIKILFITFIIYEKLTNPKFDKRLFILFFILCGLSFLIDIYILRYNLQSSLLGKNLFTIVNIFSNKFSLSDVL